MKENNYLYRKKLFKTPIGEITIIWRENTKFQIEEIILSNTDKNSTEIAIEKYPSSIEKEEIPKTLNKIIHELNKYFDGKEAQFSLDYLNLKKLTPFQRKVLIATFNTRKGNILTYKSLAHKINNPKSYRAVGSALAKNPFPIIIPCHRIIKSDKTLGGFGGVSKGLKEKEILLRIEGVEVDKRKRISESPILSLDRKKQTKITNFE